jgi:hypothetical protein
MDESIALPVTLFSIAIFKQYYKNLILVQRTIERLGKK